MGLSAPFQKRAAATVAMGLLGACTPRGGAPAAASLEHRSIGILRVSSDPTVQGGQIVPEVVDTITALGLESGGGVRSLSAGMRLVSLPNGGVLTAKQRFAESPKPVALPLRLGGGFLFVVTPFLYRAESWLSPAQPIFSSPTGIAEVVLGLDRIYLRAPNGSYQAVDPRSGTAMDLGPWPRSPSVRGYRALDGWRAVALADLRGAVATSDAGTRWKPLALPIEPKSVDTVRVDATSGEPFLVPESAQGDFLVVRGTEADRQTVACYAVQPDESTVKLSACPAAAPPDRPPAQVVDAALVKSFGARPLLAAVEDGWPVEDRTALVARDGNLARIRLADGAISSMTHDAFPSSASRCHPFPLLSDPGPPGLGFACGDALGHTTVYAYDPARPSLVEVRRFDHARSIQSFGNGSIAVRGPCAADGPPADPLYCVLSRGPVSSGDAASTPRWREVGAAEVSGSPTSRLLVFGDGRIAALHPPRSRLDDAYLAFLDGGRVTRVPLRFTPAPPEAIHALESGVWLDGFEEREPGIFGGWVDAAGSMLGIRVDEGGQVQVGAYVLVAGSPVVSGRYGLGWGPSGRGYETTDGGMTWSPIEVPEPLSVPRERACGPVGCTAAGWIRVGWGSRKEPLAPAGTPSIRSPFRPPRELDLACAALEPMPPQGSVELAPLVLHPPHFMTALPLDAVQSLYRTPPPAKRPDELMISAQADDLHIGPLARVYAWGPQAGEWAHASHWTARWLWPYGGWREVRSSASAPSAFPTLDAARRALGQTGWSMALGDEPSSVLLSGRGLGQDVLTLELDADRAPLEVRRADGEPFSSLDFAVRTGAHWYIVTPQAYGEVPASVIWRVDGATAREFARIPRCTLDSSPASVRLARRSDGRAIGLVVDGQPPPDRGVALRWVLPIDLESGTPGEPESLGAADLGDRQAVPFCGEDDAGWILDTTWSASAQITLGDGSGRRTATSGSLRNLYAREHLSSSGHACIERLSGTYEPEIADSRPSATADPWSISGRGSQDHGASILVSALRSHMRYPLRCYRK